MTRLAGRSLLRVASTRLTVLGFVALAACIGATKAQLGVPSWGLALPLAALAVNLAAALAVRPTLRSGGLGLFHVALLGCLVLVAWGRLTHFEGRVELTQGGEFGADGVETTSRGPWHGDGLAHVRFAQGPFSVRYAPALKRSHTRSEVRVADTDGGRDEIVGDDRPLRVDGFRFYTTHNKGYAPLLTWTAPGAAPISGAVHLPSYPLNDWQQQQSWTPPGGPPARFWLRLPPVDDGRAWELAPDRTRAMLVVEIAGQRFELQPGDTASGPFGALRYERLLGWMGYTISYDPTLVPLFWLACLGVGGLALHLWPFATRRREPRPAHVVSA